MCLYSLIYHKLYAKIRIKKLYNFCFIYAKIFEKNATQLSIVFLFYNHISSIILNEIDLTCFKVMDQFDINFVINFKYNYK